MRPTQLQIVIMIQYLCALACIECGATDACGAGGHNSGRAMTIIPSITGPEACWIEIWPKCNCHESARAATQKKAPLITLG